MSTSRLEQLCGPFGLFGFQARHDPVLAVLDFATDKGQNRRIGRRRLKVERYIRVARREGDSDLGEPLTKGDRIDENSWGRS